MSLSEGRHYLAIPGPSVVPDRVLQAMHRAAPNIYTGQLVDMAFGLVPDLKAVARTEHNVAQYIANGHGIWEAAVSNTLNAGDKVLVLATGGFALGWADMAGRMGVDVQIIDFGKHDTIDLEQVSRVLDADKEHKIKAVLTVHVDTGTSIKNDIPALRTAIDAANHPALFMVDCIASLGCDRFEMDAWGVDLTVAACQKGLMTPPGMGFIFFNETADAARDICANTSRYWDWRPRAKPNSLSNFFNGTAPTHHLYGLREALDMIAEEGLENVWGRHQKLAEAYWAALSAWGQNGPVKMNVEDAANRSHAVTTVSIGAPTGTDLRNWLETNTGVTLGIGLDMAPMDDPAWHGFFRLGHMGHVNAHMVLGVIGAIEAGLIALDVPHGRGAQEAAARVCAQL